jgi:hypothetical protein
MLNFCGFFTSLITFIYFYKNQQYFISHGLHFSFFEIDWISDWNIKLKVTCWKEKKYQTIQYKETFNCIIWYVSERQKSESELSIKFRKMCVIPNTVKKVIFEMALAIIMYILYIKIYITLLNKRFEPKNLIFQYHLLGCNHPPQMRWTKD